jgi:leukotriene-A4 hydrolase
MIQDASSFSNPSEASITHSDFSLDINFNTKIINGAAFHTVSIHQDQVSQVILDTRALSIHSISLLPPFTTTPTETQTDLSFTLADQHKALGSKLTITLPYPMYKGDTFIIKILFSTSPHSTAVQWLSKEQTSGGVHPFLFTQCQAIHARSFVPCQDTPSAKMTYNAGVKVPFGLTALMSALPTNNNNVDNDGQTILPSSSASMILDFFESTSTTTNASTRIFTFTQPLPIATYLIALAVGDLAYKELSPVSRVWAEPSLVGAAAYEFSETPNFLKSAEEIAGPYEWGRYDILMLPPSFPFGGMENPNVTFVTPTLTAGDRSLANVVAHEIAHSWTGNLVTNRSWSDFWLNEGFTVFLERKILEKLYGTAMYNFHASQGFVALQKTVRDLGSDHPFTALVPDLSGGQDPDDAFSRIPYEKGFYFLHYLQQVAGGPAVFDPFFKSYIQRFKAAPNVTTNDFKAYYLDYFGTTVPAVHDIDWVTWFYKRGMPPLVNSYDQSLVQASYDLAIKWHTADILGVGFDNDNDNDNANGGKGKDLVSTGPEGTSADDLKGWSSPQIVAFLDKLGELRSMTPLHPTTTRKMNALYGTMLDTTTNSEIRCSWYLLCIKAEDSVAVPLAVDFLKQQGRMKFLRPLYKALNGSRVGKVAGRECFEKTRGKYHPIARKMVESDLGLL